MPKASRIVTPAYAGEEPGSGLPASPRRLTRGRGGTFSPVADFLSEGEPRAVRSHLDRDARPGLASRDDPCRVAHAWPEVGR
jgi:hypothetical protein